MQNAGIYRMKEEKKVLTYKEGMEICIDDNLGLFPLQAPTLFHLPGELITSS
jgi:hypothetical protein